MADTYFEFVYKDAYGYTIRATIVEWNSITESWTAATISGFTIRQFKIRKPDTVVQTVTATFETDGTDGVLTYMVPAGLGLFNQAGYYEIQAILANDQQYFPTSVVGFKVETPI